jgi:hypothetical protein
MKVGADIVIIGNATSVSARGIGGAKGQGVRVGINVKVISSSQSEVVAAKSDFATASEDEFFASEIKASHRAGKKMIKFLITSIKSHWAPDLKKKKAPSSKVPKTGNSPLLFGDL